MGERTEMVLCVDGVYRQWLGQWVPYVAAGRDKVERRARLGEVPVDAREKVREEVISIGARRATAGLSQLADKEPMS